MEKINNGPLVSIVVITYNSDKFVLETLESAKAQTYQNIELVVSDDCSTDNTLDICNSWALANKSSFSDIKVIKADHNTGIAPNLNRGLKVCSGKYIKIIAGDDTLTSNCLSDYVAFFESDPEIKIAASKVEIFYDEDPNIVNIWPSNKGQFPITLEGQKLQIIKTNFIYNVSLFFTNEFVMEIGLFDETYPMIEDYPFDFKVIYSGHKFYFLDKVTVKHRINFLSTTRPLKSEGFVNVKSHNQAAAFIRKNCLPLLLQNKLYFWYFIRSSKLWLIDNIVKNGNSPNKRDNYFLHKLLFLNKYLTGKLTKYKLNF